MPELPDVAAYIEALSPRVLGRRLHNVRLLSPFVLRSVDPPLGTIRDAVVRRLSRLGKRIVFGFDDEVFLVIHLMIAGRLRWRTRDQRPGIGPKIVLAVFEFEDGHLWFTEASSRKRASLQLVRGETDLAKLDPGGVEPLQITRETFAAVLTRENHTLKRALTDPHLFSGIGNAYSDEILHAARLSPLQLSRSLSAEETDRLFDATHGTLNLWIGRLTAEARASFPEKVTAFREGMAVHGRFRQPCPRCGSPVQRIVHGDHECNYCATCQTGGRLLADRSLSRLLRDDWPKRLEPLEG